MIYTIQNRNSNLNLEVKGGLTAIVNGANIVQNTPGVNANQQFLFTHQGIGVYKITVMHSIKQVEANDNQLVDSADVQQWSNTGKANQQYIAVSTGDGFFKLIALHSARVVEVADAGTVANVCVGINVS